MKTVMCFYVKLEEQGEPPPFAVVLVFGAAGEKSKRK